MIMIDTPASTSIARVGYDYNTSVLSVIYRSNQDQLYKYYTVPPLHWDSIKDTIMNPSRSLGNYILKYIRGGFPVERVAVAALSNVYSLEAARRKRSVQGLAKTLGYSFQEARNNYQKTQERLLEERKKVIQGWKKNPPTSPRQQ